MKRWFALTVALAPALCSSPARGGEPQPVELRRLFPLEAEVQVERGGLSRLILPTEVVAACRPDLSDLRLFDAGGRETAFLVDAGTAPPGVVEATQRFEPRLLETARAEIRREGRPPLRRETYEFAMPEAAPRAGNWVLVLQTCPAEFVARVNLEGIDGQGATATLLENGSLFRLRGPRPAEKLRLPLPPSAGRRLRVVLESEQPFWIGSGFGLESARVLERGSRIAVPLRSVSVRAGDGRTIVDLERPPGIVPDLLRVETATGTFDRKLEAWDEGAAHPDEVLGSGRVFRVEGLVPVGEQEVDLRVARGDRLRVEIEDGDSPRLEELAFAAVIRQPSLIFSLPPGASGGAAGILRFGGGRAHPPRYDLGGLLPGPGEAATGKRAEAAAMLYDPAVVRPARLAATRPNSAYDGAPALAFAMHPGADIDRRLFSHRRPIAVPSAPEGLSRLRLEPDDMAVLSDDLSDLRVADDSSHQWPYLIQREAEADLLPLAVEGPEVEAGVSRYTLRLPASPLRLDRILLETDSGFFDRPYRVEGRLAEGETKTLARGRLIRAIGDPRPAGIEMHSPRLSELHLVVEDGDDVPLAFRSARARVLLPVLYLTAPAGRYALLMGAPDQKAPRYELERVRDVVLAVQAAPIEPGPIEANDAYSLKARLKGQGLQQTVMMWGALVAAVVFLAFMTLRLARREA